MEKILNTLNEFGFTKRSEEGEYENKNVVVSLLTNSCDSKEIDAIQVIVPADVLGYGNTHEFFLQQDLDDFESLHSLLSYIFNKKQEFLLECTRNTERTITYVLDEIYPVLIEFGYTRISDITHFEVKTDQGITRIDEPYMSFEQMDDSRDAVEVIISPFSGGFCLSSLIFSETIFPGDQKTSDDFRKILSRITWKSRAEN